MRRLWDLAQINLGILRAPIDRVEMAGFVSNLDRINALAEASPGFVWRLQDDSGNATAIPGPWPDDIIANLTVWESVEALDDFVHNSMHDQFLKRRREWFRPSGGRHLALWWIPAGTTPTLAEAADRLQVLSENGVTPDAFTIRRACPAPDHPPKRSSRE